MARSKQSKGTSTRFEIAPKGGYNFSEHNIQDRGRATPRANFSEQNRPTTTQTNALNAPAATKAQKPVFGVNESNDFKERTWTQPPPGQVPGLPQPAFGSADTSMLQWKMGHGFAQNDPALHGLLDERQIAPSPDAAWQWQADAYIHSDVGVPSVTNQNWLERPTYNSFPASRKKHILPGRHDHTNLKEHHTPTVDNDSNMSSGNHYTNGAFLQEFTRGPLEGPLLLSDLPPIPEPEPYY